MNKFLSMCGAVSILLAGICEADEINSLLLFGDSYFDTGAGNAVAESLGQPLVSPTPPYFDGRHSNGPIWIDYTSQLLDLPVKDFAVAGAETGSGNQSNALLGGLFQEIGRYEATSTFIPPKTLVIVDGGGNDYFNLLNFPSELTPEGLAATTEQAIENLSVVFTDLLTLGAKKTVMWNLGDMGMLPLFTDPTLGLTILAPFYTAASNVFDTALLELIQQVNLQAPGHHRVFYFDARAVFNEIAAELKAQGVNLTQHTLTTLPDGTTIVTGPQPEDLAFYDQVHPTTLVWQMFANSMAGYIDTLIDGPRFVAAEQDVALESTRAFRNVLDNHFRTLRMQHYLYCNDWSCCSSWDRFQVYLDGKAKWGSLRSRQGALGFHYNTQLFTLGSDYHWDDCLTLGASFTAQRNDSRIKSHKGTIDLHDYIPTVYALYTGCEYFAEASFSYHFYDFRHVRRKIPFLNRVTKARPHGDGIEADIEAGYVAQCGCFTFFPIFGLEYEHLYINKYKEKCGGFLDLKVPRQHQDSLMSKIGAQFYWDMFACGILPFGEVFYEHEFLRNSRTFGPSIYKANDGAIDFNRLSKPFYDVIRFAIGLDAHLAENISGNISYEGETTFRDYNNAVRIELNTVF